MLCLDVLAMKLCYLPSTFTYVLRSNPYISFLDFSCAVGSSRYKSQLFWVGFYLFLTVWGEGIENIEPQEKSCYVCYLILPLLFWYFLVCLFVSLFKHTWHYRMWKAGRGRREELVYIWVLPNLLKVSAQRKILLVDYFDNVVLWY